MTEPTVGIVLPVYNQGDLLARAIKSVLKQSSKDYQLVIVNDGSTDNTLTVAEAFVKKNSNIKLISIQHSGASQAINSGARLLKTAYLTTLDADDYYKPKHIEYNIKYLKKHPEVDLCMSKTKIIGGQYVVNLENQNEMIHLDNCAIGGTFFVRRNVFDAVGGRPIVAYGNDYFFVKNVRNHGFIVKERSTRTYVYDRTGHDSITKTEEKKRLTKLKLIQMHTV